MPSHTQQIPNDNTQNQATNSGALLSIAVGKTAIRALHIRETARDLVEKFKVSEFPNENFDKEVKEFENNYAFKKVGNIVDNVVELEATDIVALESLLNVISDLTRYYFLAFNMTNQNKKLRSLLEKGDGNNIVETTASITENQTPPQLRSFAERLEHYRKAAGLSQRALSAKAGLEQSHVSQLERSLAEPRLHTLINLADALDIDPCALIPKGRGRG